MGTIAPVGVLNQDTGIVIYSCKSPLAMLLRLTALDIMSALNKTKKNVIWICYIRHFCFWAVVIAPSLLYLYLFLVKALRGGERGHKRDTREKRPKRWHQNKPKTPTKASQNTKARTTAWYRLNSQQLGKKANPKIYVGVFRRQNKLFLPFKCFLLPDTTFMVSGNGMAFLGFCSKSGLFYVSGWRTTIVW